MLLVKDVDGLQRVESDYASPTFAFLGRVATAVAAVVSESKPDENGHAWLYTLAH